MKLKRRKDLRNIILSHIAKTIEGELLDWGNIESWIGFEFDNKKEADIAENMFRAEANRLKSRIG